MFEKNRLKYLFFIFFVGTIFILDYYRLFDSGKFVLMRAISFPARLVGDVANGVVSFGRNVYLLPSLLDMLGKGEVSIAENAVLKTEIVVLKEELDQIKKINNWSKKVGVDIVDCPILGKDLNGIADAFVIGCGENDRISEGNIVMGKHAIIGQVILVSKHTATFRPLMSSNFSIEAVLGDSLEPVIVKGSLSEGLFLELVDSKLDVREGDVVLTASLAGPFPGGIIIATLGSEMERTGLTRKIRLHQVESSGLLKQVFVVR